jgi:acetate kinase
LDLDYLGIALDAERNAAGARIVSAASGSVAVEAFATDEELVIARHVRDALAG